MIPKKPVNRPTEDTNIVDVSKDCLRVSRKPIIDENGNIGYIDVLEKTNNPYADVDPNTFSLESQLSAGVNLSACPPLNLATPEDVLSAVNAVNANFDLASLAQNSETTNTSNNE